MKGWDGNRVLGPGTALDVNPPRLLTDGKLMLATLAIGDPAQRERLARGSLKNLGPVEERVARVIWRQWLRKQQIPVKVAGWEREYGPRLYRLLSGSGRRSRLDVWVDGHRMDVLERARVSFDRITHPRGQLSNVWSRPVIFWKGKKPVALLMPLRIGADPRTETEES